MGRTDVGNYRAFIVDVDGVLVKGGEPLPGAARALAGLRELGRVIILTNNSTRSRAQTAEALRSLGFPVTQEMVVTSSYIAARWLLEREGRVRVWVIGEDGLVAELSSAGHVLSPPREAEWVVAGMDRALTYGKLADALRALLAGARFLATNRDGTFPTPEGLLPGAGAVVGAIEGMGFPPETVVGKPSPIAFEIALEVAGASPAEALMIGDRLDTDILGAQRAGLDTALILTGVSREEDIERRGIVPTMVARDLGDLVARLAAQG
ncbi:MAG: HAD-IIA family hydrolase [Caldiserica bacterium]|nr:HAD-IIA family hydrolase [Caldisericota bacterium]